MRCDLTVERCVIEDVPIAMPVHYDHAVVGGTVRIVPAALGELSQAIGAALVALYQGRK